MRAILFVVLMLLCTFANAARFEVARDGEVGAYFVGATAAYTNLLTVGFGTEPFSVQPSINNHTSNFADYTSFGNQTAGNAVTFFDYVLDTNSVWSSDVERNYDGFDHMFYSSFTLPNGIPALFVGFEDLTGGGDRDYDDIMAIFVNVSPVPEPETYLMFMLGLGLLSARRIVGRKLSAIRKYAHIS